MKLTECDDGDETELVQVDAVTDERITEGRVDDQQQRPAKMYTRYNSILNLVL